MDEHGAKPMARSIQPNLPKLAVLPQSSQVHIARNTAGNIVAYRDGSGVARISIEQYKQLDHVGAIHHTQTTKKSS